MDNFAYFSIKTYIVGIMNTHNKGFHGELIKTLISHQGPVVQIIVRITTSLRRQLVKFIWTPIVTKFYLKHHWGGGLIALDFGPGRIGTLVSMATNSSHRVIMGKMLCPL